jgi:hypothetical protein
MPESFGKRQRREAKARKAAAREERRVERNRRRASGEPQEWMLEDQPAASATEDSAEERESR